MGKQNKTLKTEAVTFWFQDKTHSFFITQNSFILNIEKTYPSLKEGMVLKVSYFLETLYVKQVSVE